MDEKRWHYLETHIAAHYFGCDFVGCELDQDYYLAAKQRFDSETKQVVLF